MGGLGSCALKAISQMGFGPLLDARHSVRPCRGVTRAHDPFLPLVGFCRGDIVSSHKEDH